MTLLKEVETNKYLTINYCKISRQLIWYYLTIMNAVLLLYITYFPI